MADWHFSKAESWTELVEAHGRWVEDYNAQDHFAREDREDGRRSPREVLGWLAGVRYRPEDLERTFFSTRFSRELDLLGYVTFRRWRLYGEEGLAGGKVALWIQEKSLLLEYGGENLSRYDVEYHPGSGELRNVGTPKLFALEDALGAGWLKALKLKAYTTRERRRPEALQQVLFAYVEAV